MKDIFKDTKDMKPGKFIIYRDPEIFKNNSLPLARIKKIMKSDECVKVNRRFLIIDDCWGSTNFILQSMRIIHH